MLVQAQDFVGFGHHQMQVVRYHQHCAVQFMAQLVDKIVKRHLAIDVNTLGRFIQHQQLWAVEQGAGQQYALGFAAGEFLHRRVDQMPGLHTFQCRQDVVFAGTRAQTQEAADGQRQRGVKMQLLRHVANPQAVFPLDDTLCWCYQPQNHSHKGRFTGAVRAQQG